MQIYATRGQLQQYVANLELTINAYNKVGVDQAVSRQGNVYTDENKV